MGFKKLEDYKLAIEIKLTISCQLSPKMEKKTQEFNFLTEGQMGWWGLKNYFF